ncbi:22604_t:CDS:2, partial [Dentiscutata erythropus]
MQKVGKNFKLAIQEEIDRGEENENNFRLYCEKVLMEFYNLVDVFPTLPRMIKIMKTSNDSGITLVDVKGVCISDNKEIWHMEVSGPPSNPITRHTADDTKKTLHTDILNLINILRNHLDLDVNIAKKIKVFSMQVIAYRLTLYAFSMLENGQFVAYKLASAELPFDFDSRSKYMAVMRIIAIFHEAIMDKIDRILIPCKDKSIRSVLRIPKH